VFNCPNGGVSLGRSP